MSFSGLPTLAPVVQQQEAKTYVEEWLRGSRMVPVVAGRGRDGDGRVKGRELQKH